MQSHHGCTIHVGGKSVLFGGVVGFLRVDYVLLPFMSGAYDAHFVPQACGHHVMIAPFGSDSIVVERPKVAQMFHGVGAGWGILVCMCHSAQVFTGKVLHIVQCGGPTVVQRIEGPGPLAQLCRGRCLV